MSTPQQGSTCASNGTRRRPLEAPQRRRERPLRGQPKHPPVERTTGHQIRSRFSPLCASTGKGDPTTSAEEMSTAAGELPPPPGEPRHDSALCEHARGCARPFLVSRVRMNGAMLRQAQPPHRRALRFGRREPGQSRSGFFPSPSRTELGCRGVSRKHSPLRARLPARPARRLSGDGHGRNPRIATLWGTLPYPRGHGRTVSAPQQRFLPGGTSGRVHPAQVVLWNPLGEQEASSACHAGPS
jgi:hypothetical protein